jgi:hypothetical protein
MLRDTQVQFLLMKRTETIRRPFIAGELCSAKYLRRKSSELNPPRTMDAPAQARISKYRRGYWAII